MLPALIFPRKLQALDGLTSLLKICTEKVSWLSAVKLLLRLLLQSLRTEQELADRLIAFGKVSWLRLWQLKLLRAEQELAGRLVSLDKVS